MYQMLYYLLLFYQTLLTKEQQQQYQDEHIEVNVGEPSKLLYEWRTKDPLPSEKLKQTLSYTCVSHYKLMYSSTQTMS